MIATLLVTDERARLSLHPTMEALRVLLSLLYGFQNSRTSRQVRNPRQKLKDLIASLSFFRFASMLRNEVAARIQGVSIICSIGNGNLKTEQNMLLTSGGANAFEDLWKGVGSGMKNGDATVAVYITDDALKDSFPWDNCTLPVW